MGDKSEKGEPLLPDGQQAPAQAPQVVFQSANTANYQGMPQAHSQQAYTYVTTGQVQPLSNGEESSATCWFVVGIISTICCFFPLGLAGTILAYTSKEDAQRGNAAGHKKKLCLAKGFTIAAILIGVIALVAVIIWLVLSFAGLFSFGSAFSGSSDDWQGEQSNQKWIDEGIYLGCFRDNIFPGELQGSVKDFGNSNYVRKCVQYCAENRYKYAGLQGTKCYCDDSYGRNGKRLDYNCDITCLGFNSTDACGGVGYNSIYRTYYIGCYDEGSSQNYSLGEYVGRYVDHQYCLNMCYGAGYEFVGFEANQLCHCGNDFNRYKQANRDDCVTPCLDDSAVACGSVTKNSVYKTRYIHHAKYFELGCYLDRNSSRDINDYHVDLGSDMGVDECVEVCSEQGYKYAGLQQTDCYCSQSYGRYGKTDKDECDVECARDYRRCGGRERNTVYRTSYIGCFKDEYYRSLNASVSTLKQGSESRDNQGVVPADCIETCKTYGYLFAGIQEGHSCFCGQDFNRYEELPEAECDTPCTGDEKKACGGSFKNSVYRTFLE